MQNLDIGFAASSRFPMSRRTFASMVAAGAASALVQGTAAVAQPAPKGSESGLMEIRDHRLWRKADTRG